MPALGDSTTLEYLLLELVLNALKARATAIAVRIHLSDRRIQVVDNGDGIAKNALKYIGESSWEIEARSSASEAKDVATDGHLAKIREWSSCLIVMSRCWFTTKTYGKFFSNGEVPEVQRMRNRPSRGTTIIVYASTESCNWSKEIDAFAVKSIIVYLSLVNSQVSFSVRDDKRGSIVLRIGKYQKKKRLLRVIFEKPLSSDQVRRIKRRKIGKVQISGFWGVECTEVRKIQQVLVNLRPVECLALENFMIRIITNFYCSHQGNAEISPEKIFFLLYIDCPDTEYNISVKETKLTADFHQINQILDSVEGGLGKPEVKSVIPSRICGSLGKTLGVKQKTTFGTKVSRRSLLNIAITTEVKRRVSSLSKVRKISRFGSEDSNVENRDIAPIVQQCKEVSAPTEGQELPIVSPHWPKNDSETAGEVCEIQESVKQSRKTFDDSQQQLENTTADESLPAVKEYQYDNHGVLWISQKCNEKLSNRMEETYDVDCSQWSDWIYEPVARNRIGEKPDEFARPVLYRRFKFLPLALHALLPFLNKKLINRDLSEDVGTPTNLNFDRRRQDLDVQRCARSTVEFRLKTECLKSMKVLNQVNREFIVALAKQDENNLVVVVDQHAMHERIRYENLMRAYRRDQKNQQFTSMILQRPIIISDFSASACSLLSSNLPLLTRYGLNLASRSETILLIFAVPQCFVKKTFRADNTEVEIAVRKLLRELLDDLSANGPKKPLPFTIHDAIASEACHGAIKFGDALTLKECESLIACWKETDAPNRCAHGRPSVVPLLELSSHRRNHYKRVRPDKLNFASLREFRRATGKVTSRYHSYVTLTKKRRSRFHENADDDDDEALRVDNVAQQTR